jgi:hypothetical protein
LASYSKDWSLIAQRINKRFKYKPGLDAFTPEHYASYEDWFLRKLSVTMHQKCLAQAGLADVCAPVQGKLWPQARDAWLKGTLIK